MKLYSKHHLVGAAVFGIIVATSLTSAAFVIVPKVISNNKNETTQTETDTSETAPKNSQNTNLTSTSRSATSKDGNITVPGIIENVPENISQTEIQRDVQRTSAIQYTQDEQQNISVYEKCSPSVVNISTRVTGVNWFLEPVVQEGGSGSGSIIDSRGYVLTNVHVISGASQIYVSLSDGTQYEAEVVGQDIDSDLAVIKFNPPAKTVLQTIPFGNSANLKVGQKVIAIGNPFGLERTMTTGIVSGLGRPIRNSANRIIRNMIQTDTAINPGNSGGPLLDTQGRMIGINTMIYSSSGDSAGIGFAVPAETAVRVVADLMQYGRVNRGVIQASIVQLNSAIVRYANLNVHSGILISEVTRGGNAEKAGIQGGTQAARYGRDTIYLGGDIVTQIDEIPVASLADYFSALESKRPGDTVQVKVRRNRRDVTMTVTLANATN